MVVMAEERIVLCGSFLGRLLSSAEEHVASQDHKYEGSCLSEKSSVYISSSVPVEEKDVGSGN